MTSIRLERVRKTALPASPDRYGSGELGWVAEIILWLVATALDVLRRHGANNSRHPSRDPRQPLIINFVGGVGSSMVVIIAE